MATRPAREKVTVYSLTGKALRLIDLPKVFNAPVRQDIVNHVHSQMRMNRRMPHGVSPKAGHQTSAESWGTGRAVARIPRVRGGGTHRSGQGAFGNMCRGGHMFGAKKVWRRIHRKINVNEKRYAMVSAIAASGSPALVMAKGHKISRIREVPLVIEDSLQSFKRTKVAAKFLKHQKIWPDIVRVWKSKKVRPGKGKVRNRRYRKSKGPIIIYAKNEGCSLAFRNIPGVSTGCVTNLNLLRIAPGGRVGRMIIWTESAFKMLNSLYGTYHQKSELKVDYNLPKPIMTSADLMQILRDENIKRHLKAPRFNKIFRQVKLNPLKNRKQMYKLNPYARVERALAQKQNAEGIKNQKLRRIEREERIRHVKNRLLNEKKKASGEIKVLKKKKVKKTKDDDKKPKKVKRVVKKNQAKDLTEKAKTAKDSAKKTKKTKSAGKTAKTAATAEAK